MKRHTSDLRRGATVFLAVLVVTSLVTASVAFAGGTAAQASSGDVDWAPDQSFHYEGQELTATIPNDGQDTDYQLRRVDSSSGDAITSSSATSIIETADGYEVTIDTDGLSEGTYFLRGNDVEETMDNTFELLRMELDVSFEADTVIQGGEVGIEFEDNRGSYTVNVSADGLDDEALEAIFDTNGDVVDTHSDEDGVVELALTPSTKEFDAYFPEDVDAGEYTFEFDVTDANATVTATNGVTNEDVDRSFTDAPSGSQGDLIEVPVELEHTDEGAIVLGDEDDIGFETAVNFTVDSIGSSSEIVLEYNTHSHTQSDGSGTTHGWTVHSDDEDDVTIQETWAVYPGEGPAAYDVPLGAGEYELAIGERFDGTELTRVTDTTWFEIEAYDPSSATLSLQTAPLGSDLSDVEAYEDATVTETDTVADGDELVGVVGGLGMGGAIADLVDDGVEDGDDITTELDDLGLITEISPSEPPADHRTTDVWTTDGTASGSNVYQLRLDAVNVESYDGEQLLFVLNTSQATTPLDVDERYNVSFEVTELSEYVDADESHLEEQEVRLEKPSLEWHADPVEVSIDENAEVTGTSNVAPGSEIETHARARGAFLIQSDAEVSADGTFTAEFDFRNERAGSTFDLTASHINVEDFAAIDEEYNETLRDEIEAQLVSSMTVVDTGIQVEADAPADVAVGEDASLDVTVTNAGAESEEVELLVVIDGESVDERTVELDSNDTFTDSYAFDTSSEGDITWSVTADEETTGTVTVSNSATGDDSDQVPGFGVVVALVALFSVTLFARLHRD